MQNKEKEQGRRWCLTLNNWTELEYNKIKCYVANRNLWIIGKEIGKEKKVPHLQIYFESKTPVRFTTLKKLNSRLHIEKAKYDIWHNYNYCKKDGNFETNIKEKDIIPEEEKLKHYVKHFLHHENNEDIDEIIELAEWTLDNFCELLAHYNWEKLKNKIENIKLKMNNINNCVYCEKDKTNEILIRIRKLKELWE